MPSINDVLKEKFNVSGSNIADTLSKINPSGGGSGDGGSSGTGWLQVPITVNGNAMRMEVPASEIYEAFPNVTCVLDTVINEQDAETDELIITGYERSLFSLVHVIKYNGSPQYRFGVYDSVENESYDFEAETDNDYPIHTGGR